MTFRRSLLLFTACTAVCFTPSAERALAATGSGVTPGPDAAQTPTPTSAPSIDPASETSGLSSDIVVRRKQLLLKQKDVPSAVTEVTKQDIQAAGNQSSIYSLLQQSAPNVNVYQQGPGNNYPVFSVRGVRGAELAQTLDGVPMQDLIFGGQGQFLANNIGFYFNRNQIDNVTVLPGVAAPGTQGYGSIGGTLAYESKKPTDDRSFEVFGSYGSFNTSEFGFTANTGKIAEAGDLKIMLQYDQLETDGFVNYTSAKYRDTMLAFSKPWMDGESTLSGYIIYNNDNGYLQSQPTPTDYLNTYGEAFNFDPSTTFFREENDFLNIKLTDETYLADDTVKLSASAFYLQSNSTSYSYQDVNTISPPVGNTPYYLFTQVPFNFYGQTGIGTPFFNQNYYNYNPSIYGNAANGAGGNSEINIGGTQTYGIAPRVTWFTPPVLGVTNTLTLGTLIVKETQQTQAYVGATPEFPIQEGINQFANSGQQRDLYQLYFQDKIDLLDGKAHIEPGFTYEGALGSNYESFSFFHGQYTLRKWDREFLPYVAGSYDLPYNIKIFASYGKSALFAPVSNYTLGSAGSTTNAPSAAIQNAFEVGARYDTDEGYLSLDYFYQKTNRAFGFYANYLTGFSEYNNSGIEEFKGVEGAGKYRLTPDVTVFGSAGYVLAKYLQSYSAFTSIGEDQFGYAFKGDPISGVPDVTGSLGVDFNHTNAFQPDDKVFARLYATFTGREYTTYDINPNPAVTPNPLLQAATVTNRAFTINPRTLLNFELDYTIPTKLPYVKSLTLELNGQNITNLHYSNYFYNQYTTFGGVYGGLPFSNALIGPPAALTATLRAKF